MPVETRESYLTEKDVSLPWVTYAEVATILAALRVFQRGLEADSEAHSDMEHFEDVRPLTADEIDELCERINTYPTTPQITALREARKALWSHSNDAERDALATMVKAFGQ